MGGSEKGNGQTQADLRGIRTHKLQDCVKLGKTVLDWGSCEDKPLGRLTRAARE
jgi:hypothetical protein